MNSFQKQFNSLLGIALGAQKANELPSGGKKLGTPKAPSPSAPKQDKQPNTFMDTKELNYDPFGDFGGRYRLANSTASLDPATTQAILAKQRSLQNLLNRQEALKSIKRERGIKQVVGSKKSDLPLGSIKTHNLGGNL